MKLQSWTPRVYAPLLLGHLGVLLFVGERWILASSYAFVLAILAFTVLLCWRRLHLSVSHNTPLWGLLLGALLAQFAAFALLLVDACITLRARWWRSIPPSTSALEASG